jgi:disulfide bond formation protein DsbB
MTERTAASEARDEGMGSRLDDLLATRGQQAVLLVALVATAGSLYFSEIRHFLPCELCWYQRILMYPIAVLALIGVVRRDRALPFYVLPLSLAGILVSSYHYLLQNRVIRAGIACQGSVPCTGKYIQWPPPGGPITIPFLALVAFVLITFAASAALRRAAEDGAVEPLGRRAWLVLGLAISVAGLLVLVSRV